MCDPARIERGITAHPASETSLLPDTQFSAIGLSYTSHSLLVWEQKNLLPDWMVSTR